MNMIERKHLHHVSDNNNVVSNEKGNIHTTTLPLYICNSVGREARPLKKKRNTRHFGAKKVWHKISLKAPTKKDRGKIKPRILPSLNNLP